MRLLGPLALLVLADEGQKLREKAKKSKAVRADGEEKPGGAALLPLQSSRCTCNLRRLSNLLRFLWRQTILAMTNFLRSPTILVASDDLFPMQSPAVGGASGGARGRAGRPAAGPGRVPGAGGAQRRGAGGAAGTLALDVSVGSARAFAFRRTVASSLFECSAVKSGWGVLLRSHCCRIALSAV